MKKRTAILAGFLLLSIAFSSVAYAHWLKVIQMEGYVTTGELHLTPTLRYGVMTQYKPVAEWGRIITCGINNNVYFEIWNTYPCLDACLELIIENDGSIPAGFHSIMPFYVERWVGVGADGLKYTDDDVWEAFSDFHYAISGDMVSGYRITIYHEDPATTLIPAMWNKIITIDVTLSALDPPGGPLSDVNPHGWLQIDPGGSVKAIACLHFWEGLWQDSSFRFGIELEYWNWNEVQQ